MDVKKLSIENIGLSKRSVNALHCSGVFTVGDMLEYSEESLAKINSLGTKSINEIINKIQEYKKTGMTDMDAQDMEQISLYDLMIMGEYHDAILNFVRTKDIDVNMMGLSNRPKNGLVKKNYNHLSDFIFMTRSELIKIPYMGAGSADEIIGKIKEYLEANKDAIIAYINGDGSALWSDDDIKAMVMNLYKEIGFKGLSLNDFEERLKLPKEITIERLKNVIGNLIAEKKLEYVDYRCYRIYDRFEDYVQSCESIKDRGREFISKRLNGKTLEAIADENGLTRERVRQIVKGDIEKVRGHYLEKTGLSVFDEDYYRYLYENYSIDKKDGTDWLGIPGYVWKYFELIDIKPGKNDLNDALEDRELDLGLRLKIKNYLNRNKIFIDGRWVEKKRADLELVAVRKLCKEEVTFEEYAKLYNAFLEDEDIPYDEDIYYTEGVLKTRRNFLAGTRFLLWKRNEKLRYYDIDGQDYSELLETLNLDSYEDIELSTLKFMRDYPEIMRKYDIRDHYELHNLLRKIIPDGSYHDFHCSKMPNIFFGSPNRDEIILEMLLDNAPISVNDLANMISEEYGYDPLVVSANYLQNFSEYNHQGIYYIDQKVMKEENRSLLKEALTEDFYFIDEIRDLYQKLVPNADTSEINSYNLKSIGFEVYSKHAIKNHDSTYAFFKNLLTKDDMYDITPYRKRYCYVQMFSSVLMELKRNLQIVEYEPNWIINYRKLEQAGITKESIHEYCDLVYEYAKEGEYFSIQSLRASGFEADILKKKFSDWFYSNLLISDSRFSYGQMFLNLVFYKGKADISIKSFVTRIINDHKHIDTVAMIKELEEVYGCIIHEKTDILKRIYDTEIYYNRKVDRLYANEEEYYKELEEGEL